MVGFVFGWRLVCASLLRGFVAVSPVCASSSCGFVAMLLAGGLAAGSASASVWRCLVLSASSSCGSLVAPSDVRAAVALGRFCLACASLFSSFAVVLFDAGAAPVSCGFASLVGVVFLG